MMTPEFEVEEEPKDRTKLVWLGIGLLILVMIGIIGVQSNMRDPAQSVVRSRHILIKCNHNDPTDRQRALELITELRQRIVNGESFKKLAKEYSDDPGSASRGGDLGYLPKGKFEEAYENWVWNAEPNELSEVIATDQGFHIILLVDKYLSEADRFEQELNEQLQDNAE